MKKLKVLLLSACLMASIILPTNNIFASHTHTDACYGGAVKHTCEGSPTEYGSCYSSPITHTHTASCYSKNCIGSDYDLIHTLIGNCDVCGSPLYSVTINCRRCGATGSFVTCSNDDCEKNVSPTYYDEHTLNHNDLSESEAIAQHDLICGKEEGEVIGYTKTCGKEDGAYYYSDGTKASLMCDKLVVSFQPAVVNATFDTFSNKVILTYMDGHSSTIEAVSDIGTLDKNSYYDSYPVNLTFKALMADGSIESDQTAICYLTNIVDINSSIGVDSVEGGNDTFETVAAPETQEVEEKEEVKEEIITSTPTPTIEPKQEDEQFEFEVVEDNQPQVEQEQQTSSASLAIAIVVIVVALIGVFVVINFVIIKKRNN